MRNDINIRSPRFLLARTMGTCWRCFAPTPLVALALPPGHMVLELDHETQDESLAIDVWRIASASAFVFYVEFIPASVQYRLKQFTRLYRLAAQSRDGVYWANHCERCNWLLDDHELFCEPDGAFLPTNDASASMIQLLPVDEAFEAVAGGYEFEPAHFSAMR